MAWRDGANGISDTNPFPPPMGKRKGTRWLVGTRLEKFICLSSGDVGYQDLLQLLSGRGALRFVRTDDIPRKVFKLEMCYGRTLIYDAHVEQPSY
ncbi:hypothetical protein AVEN_212867-1 [Araneus ventricosus]|uniref:Uncharacterized protein n=1 Tax=Araneus ventricosus TaxID=182803 RepID=A0A4Y2F665_ARAVE|nr:hypothetical protein AVEN_212867-1 [Araneus ventricosus]